MTGRLHSGPGGAAAAACTVLGSLVIPVHPAVGQVFFEQPFYPTDSVRHAIAAGDLNGDGLVDIVTTSDDEGVVSVRLNAQGRLAAEHAYDVGLEPRGVVLGDLDADTDLDLVVTSASGATVLLNQGDGTFVESASYPAGVGAGPVAVSDVDGDNDLDVAVAATISGDVFVFLNDGNEALESPTVTVVGSSPSALAIGDLNSDGKPDLAVTRSAAITPEGWGDVVVIFNIGRGEFVGEATYVIGSAPSAVAIGDLNRDNELDMVVTVGGGLSAAFLFNRGGGDFGDGTVSDNQYLQVGTLPRDVILCDADHDGDLDVVITTVFGARVMLNEGGACQTCLVDGGDCCVAHTTPGCGDLTCQEDICNLDPYCCDVEWDAICAQLATGQRWTPSLYQTDVDLYVEAFRVAAGDVNGDGLDDLAVTNEGDGYGYLSVLVNYGGGVFRSELAYDVSDGMGLGDGPIAVVMGDFDGDLAADLATVNPVTNDVSVLMNDGGGTFGPPTVPSSPPNPIVNYPVGNAPRSIATADFDGDDRLDLVVANRNGASISVLLNSGDGIFDPETQFATWLLPVGVTTGDIDGDGDADVVVGHEFGATVSVLTSNGDGTFADYASFSAVNVPWALALGDLDGDLDLDLVVVSRSDDLIAVLRNDGAGVFTLDQTTYGVGLRPRSVAVGDWDRDGDNDVAVASEDDGTVTILSNSGDGTLTATASHLVRLGARHLATGDLDADGDLDLAVAHGDFTYALLVNQDGLFEVVLHRTGVYETTSLALGDVDGNGAPDLAITDGHPDRITVALNVSTPDLCPADIDGSGSIDIIDVLQVLADWGPCPGCASDLDGNGAVDVTDLTTILGLWGDCA